MVFWEQVLRWQQSFVTLLSYLLLLGGGGSTYSAYLDSLRVLEEFGHGKMRIVDPKSLPADAESVSCCLAKTGGLH